MRDSVTEEKCSLVIKHWSLWEANYCFSLLLPHISRRHCTGSDIRTNQLTAMWQKH